MEKTNIYLIRHGETTYNAGQLIQGHMDIPLSEKGKDQADSLAQRLHKNVPIQTVISSDLTRAKQTAEIVSRRMELSPVLDPRWREIFLGRWQGKSWPDIMAQDPEEREEYLANWYTYRGHGGESWEQMHERIREALREAIAKNLGKSIAIVTHGGAIRLAIIEAMDLTVRHYPFVFENTSITELRFHENRWWLSRMNDAAHLEG